MAESVKGIQVTWGIAAGAITAAHVATTSGILESFSVTPGGNVEEVMDEDGDIVSRVDHGTTNTIEFTVKAISTSTLPVKGDELEGLGTLDGIDFDTGRVFVEDASADSTAGAVKTISVTAKHYPDMPADPS